MTVSMDTLRDWLDQGRPVTVLDVRPSDQHAEWAIPGVSMWMPMKRSRPMIPMLFSAFGYLRTDQW